MPGQRSARGRARGSWALRLAGISFVVLVAGGAVAVDLLASHRHAAKPPRRLSTKVASVQTVGLLTPGATGQVGSAQFLVLSPGGLTFTAVSPGSTPVGYPQWTADQMVGGSYVFIYVSSGRCLAATSAVAATLQRCDLSGRQRWIRVYRSSSPDGQGYWQLRNAADGRCLTVGSPAPVADGARSAAQLQRCAARPSWTQLITFSSGY